MTLWTWDIETTEWDQVRCVVAISENGDVERFAGAGALERCDDLMMKAKGTWCAHAGGIFDTLLLTNVRSRPWQELVMSGTAVLCAKDKSLKVRDTFRWWLAGLGKVGQYLEKLEAEKRARGEAAEPVGTWKKKDVDRGRIAHLSDVECMDYCESDTRILLKGVQEAQKYLLDRGARKAWTAGACALALLQKLEPAGWELLRRHSLDLETAIHAGRCVRGARVEAWALGTVPKVYSYDLKSAYPSAYADKKIGIGAIRLNPGDKDRPGSVWRCRWCWMARDRIPPVTDDATGAGAGWCEAWLIPSEWEALNNDPDCKDLVKLEGWAPERMVPIGQVFAKELFAEKENGSFFAKVFLNSLHGKFSEHPIKECWQSGEKPTEFYGAAPELVDHTYWRFCKESLDKNGRCPSHIQPLAAAHILGRTRMALFRIIEAVQKAGGEVYYCDTDCVHTSLAPHEMPVELGNGLGQLAFEGGPYVGMYLGPKAYCLVKETPLAGGAVALVAAKGACKGVPWNSLVDGIREGGELGGHVFRQARDREHGQDLRMDVFTEAITRRGGARVQKGGIASWVTGLRLKEGWRKVETTRTLKPAERAKTFDREAGTPTAWSYRTPAEVLEGLKLPLEYTPPENTADPLDDLFGD
ncbi:MAG: hypothetical protein WCO19_01930 [Candidatus Saccharibacteria bacterium]